MSFIIYADTELLSEKIWGAAYNMCNLRYNIPKVISAVVHNISKYDYHFIIKELPEKLKGQFEGLVKNTEKSIKFYTTIQKWNEYDMVTTTTKKIIDSVRFMASPPLTLADNLTEELQKDKCKVYKLSPWACDGKRFKCMECDKYYYTKFNEDLIKRFK